MTGYSGASTRTRYLIQALKNATLRTFVANVIAQEQPVDIAAPLAELLDDRSDICAPPRRSCWAGWIMYRLTFGNALAQAGREDQHPIVRQNAQESLQHLIHARRR